MPSSFKGIRRQFAVAGIGLAVSLQFAQAGTDNAMSDKDNDVGIVPQNTAMIKDSATTDGIPHSGGEQAFLQTRMDAAFTMAALGIDMRVNHPVVGGLHYRKLAEEKFQKAADEVTQILESGFDGAAVDPETGTPYFVYALRLAYEARRPELIEVFLDNGADPEQRIHPDMPLLETLSRTKRETLEVSDFGLEQSLMDMALQQFVKGQYHSRPHTDAALEIIQTLEHAGASLDDADIEAIYLDDLSDALFTSYKDFAHNLVGWESLAAHGMAKTEERVEAMQMPGLDIARDIDGDTALDPDFLAQNGAKLADYDHLYPGQGEIDYTVQDGDTLWDIAGRFQLLIGADDRQEALAMLKSANNYMPDGGDHIESGTSITIPVTKHDKQPVYARLNSTSVLYGIAAEIRDKLGINNQYADDVPSLKAIVQVLIRNNKDTLKPYLDKAETAVIPPLQPGQTLTFRMPWIDYTIEGGKEQEIKITNAHAVEGLVQQIHAKAEPAYASENTPSLSATRSLIEAYNNVDLQTGVAELTPARRYWVHTSATLSNHVPRLDKPATADNAHDTYLAVIEDGANYHHENTYGIAAHTMTKINDNAESAQLMAWKDFLPATFLDLKDKSRALRIMMNAGALQTDEMLVFSYSAAEQRSYERINIEAQARLLENSAFVLMQSYLENLYENAPVVIRGAGNARQSATSKTSGPSSVGMGSYVTSDLLAFSPKTVTVGATDKNTNYAPDGTQVIRDYSNYGGAICLTLPDDKGVPMEGTSYSTPSFAALTRQMIDWYGHRLDFEEVFAAAAMTTSQGIKDFDPFGEAYKDTTEGRRAIPAGFVTNGAGLAYHGRCGFGYLGKEEIRRWHALLQDMIEWKEAHNLYVDTVNRQLSIGEVDYVATNPETDKPEYIYTVEIPVDMTLDKLSLLLPQERFARSGVTVESPSGFKYDLPDTLIQGSYTRAFSYEDVKAGQELTIRTGAPLIEDAQVFLYGHEDGNVIQAARDSLKAEDKLYPPLHRLKANEVVGRLDSDPAHRVANIHREAKPQ